MVKSKQNLEARGGLETLNNPGVTCGGPERVEEDRIRSYSGGRITWPWEMDFLWGMREKEE